MVSKSKILIVSILIISVTLVWIIAPLLSNLLTKNSDPFSELWLLGPERTAENYPHNITSNQNYVIYLGVRNQLNQVTEYSLRVKLCNTVNQLPNSSTAEPSSLPVIEEFKFTLSDEDDWETYLAFALDFELIQLNVTRIENVRINDITIPVNYDSNWDSNRNGFYSILLFELWTYNVTSNTFAYTNQNVYLHLNMTSNFVV
ncbi:MAG: DUF1616 domain-containing protein [Candidatus Bathyarchaeota archaeon]|nr:MAG: DUF1616 domain-containing protein [Candidatus Bathyarchaeota archaeon]